MKGLQDRSVGMVYICIGLGAAVIARHYGLGSLREIGPGLFPLCLGILLAGLGAWLLVVPSTGADTRHHPPATDLIRPALYVCGSVVLFAVLLPIAGMLIASFLLVTVSSLAHRRTSLRVAAINGVALTTFAWALFVLGLGLPLPLTPPWPGV
jgi:hypothetical protein